MKPNRVPTKTHYIGSYVIKVAFQIRERMNDSVCDVETINHKKLDFEHTLQ